MAEFAPTAPDPVAEALANSLPGLRRLQVQGWLGIAAILAATVFLVVVLWNSGEDGFSWALVMGILGLVLAGTVAAWVKRSHEAAIMPILASTLNLTHEKTAKWFMQQIPQTFIPRGGKQHCDDLMSGKIAERSFRFAEVKTETGGKNSSVLFDGVVIEVTARSDLPEFLIAPVRQTRGFWIFKGNINVEDMGRWHTGYGTNDEEYGLWSPSNQPAERKVMEALMDKMIGLGSSLGAGSSLYSVACTGRDIYVALRHKHEMFRIGGAFATQDEMMADIRTATAELEVPLRLAAEVVRAEEALHGAAVLPAAPHA